MSIKHSYRRKTFAPFYMWDIFCVTLNKSLDLLFPHIKLYKNCMNLDYLNNLQSHNTHVGEDIMKLIWTTVIFTFNYFGVLYCATLILHKHGCIHSINYTLAFPDVAKNTQFLTLKLHDQFRELCWFTSVEDLPPLPTPPHLSQACCKNLLVSLQNGFWLWNCTWLSRDFKSL